MTEVTVTDPDEVQTAKKVDDRGRVYVGTDYSGKRVRVVMEVMEVIEEGETDVE